MATGMLGVRAEGTRFKVTRYYWRCQCGARSSRGWWQEERRDKAYRLHERSKRHIQWVKRRALEKAKRCPMCGRSDARSAS